MAARMKINTLMENMFAAGLLNNQFQELQLIGDGSAPNFISEVITIFCKEGWQTISELATMLDKPCVDFKNVGTLLYKIEGSCAIVGAQRVKNSCIQFHQFCEEKSRDGCLKALDVVRNDFYDLLVNFQTMVQLEQQVRTVSPKQ